MINRILRWLFPHPLLTAIVAIVWVMLQNQFSAGMAVFGVILGIIIPRITAIWWPDRPQGFRPLKMLSYMGLVIYDIIVANIEVAWIILTKSNDQISPLGSRCRSICEHQRPSPCWRVPSHSHLARSLQICRMKATACWCTRWMLPIRMPCGMRSKGATSPG